MPEWVRDFQVWLFSFWGGVAFVGGAVVVAIVIARGMIRHAAKPVLELVERVRSLGPTDHRLTLQRALEVMGVPQKRYKDADGLEYLNWRAEGEASPFKRMSYKALFSMTLVFRDGVCLGVNDLERTGVSVDLGEKVVRAAEPGAAADRGRM